MKPSKSTVFALTALFVSTLLLFVTASCTLEAEHADESVKVEHAKSAVEAAPAEPAEPRFVANPFCAACHADFDEDKFAVTHEKAGIGCERCHGESERHRSDEDNITPPELMFPKEKINPTCMMCHPRQDITHVTSHGKLLEGADTIFDEEPAEEDTGPKYCTDCHAKEHRMNVRTIRWNKYTGEILDK